jgi:CHAT domain-containing protein
MLYRNRQYEKAFEYVERSKARALVDLLATKKDFAVKSGSEQEIRAVLAMNETADTETIIRDVSIDKSKTRSVQITLRQDIQTKSPELASLVTVTSPSVSALQSHIPADEVLIEYYYRDKDMYAFVVSKSGLRAIKLNVTGLTEDIQAFRNDIQSYNSNQYAAISKKLHKRLIQPLEEHLDKRNLIIVPHGVLHYLPFNALHDGQSYLIDKYSIRLLPSAGVIQYLKAGKANKAGDILVFGNPDLGDPADDLDNAQNEALAVAKMRPRSKVFLRKEATISAFQKYSSAFNIIHFATHGQFNPDDPLKSALLLARDSESDGRLTIDRLYSTKLDADLVTLSACETGLSTIANGDDLVGLTRGFLYAGSSSIVASLWEVNDFTTSQLMTRFYKEMDRTDKREALRTAQLETKKKYPHPYYWASFQLTGNAK